MLRPARALASSGGRGLPAGPPRRGRVELLVTRSCLFHSVRLRFPEPLLSAQPAGDIREPRSPGLASAWHHADAGVSPP